MKKILNIVSASSLGRDILHHLHPSIKASAEPSCAHDAGGAAALSRNVQNYSSATSDINREAELVLLPKNPWASGPLESRDDDLQPRKNDHGLLGPVRSPHTYSIKSSRLL